jgi:hypothetical protein
MADESKFLAEELQKISLKVEQAVRIRQKLVNRISDACKRLKVNPADKSAREDLAASLKKEREFIKIIRKGAAQTPAILKKIKKSLKKTFAPQEQKQKLENIILNILDMFKFLKRNLGYVEDRIKFGEKLVSKDTAGEKLDEFIKDLNDEKAIEEELGKRLRGEVERIWPTYKAVAGALGVGVTGSILTPMLAGAFMGAFAGPVPAGMSQPQQNIFWTFYAATAAIGLMGGVIVYLQSNEKRI